MERPSAFNPEKRIPIPEDVTEETSQFEWDEDGRVLKRVKAEDSNEVPLEEDASNFRVVSENEYGLNLEREKSDVEKFGPKTEAQKVALRSALALVGVIGAYTTPNYQSSPEKTEAETEIIYTTDDMIESVTAFLSPEEQTGIRAPEDESHLENNPAFYAEVSGYVARANLRFDEVQFVDASNRPIGEPVKLESFTITKDSKPYLVTPGPVNEHGIITDGIAGEWLTEMRRRIREENPNVGEIGVLSVASHFEAALMTADEPELVVAIANGSITTYRQLVDYYLNKSVIGAEHVSRRNYIEERIKFSENVPAVAQEEFRRLVVGLVMQETGGNNGLVSRTGAQGIFQFQPVTWNEQGGRPEEIRSLKRQVEMAGKYLSTLYRQVQHFAGDDAMRILRERHSDEELARDVLVPLSINAYNAGASRLGEAVKVYFSNRANREKDLKGRDLFLDIINYAHTHREGKLAAFGDDAHEYAIRVTANSMAMRNEQSPAKVNTRIAFNF